MKRIKSYEGINVYESSLIQGGICLPGFGIFINTKLFPKRLLPSVMQHEYGHYLDYKYANDLKPFCFLQFYIRIGIPSLFNALTGVGGPHRNYWTEIRANKMAKAYFGDQLDDKYLKYFPTE